MTQRDNSIPQTNILSSMQDNQPSEKNIYASMPGSLTNTSIKNTPKPSSPVNKTTTNIKGEPNVTGISIVSEAAKAVPQPPSVAGAGGSLNYPAAMPAQYPGMGIKMPQMAPINALQQSYSYSQPMDNSNTRSSAY
jgi:hypothetical protein